MRRELLECLDMMKRIGAMNECVYDRIMLNESTESKSQSKAKDYFMSKTGCEDRTYADYFVRHTLRENVRSLRDKNCAKFTLGVTRLYLEGQFDFDDSDTISKLDNLLYFLAYKKKDAINYDLNGMNLQQLFDMFYGEVETSQENGENNTVQKQYTTNKDYTIVKIPDFETASQYSGYTTWCVTQDSGMYNQYTSGGMGIFYFCLRNDFKNFGRPEEEEPGENAPLDDYGLSMIAVSVDAEGNYNTCTCRWNHGEGGNDSILNAEQISNLIGDNFYNVFKPRLTTEELEQKRKQIISRDDSGIDGIDIIQNGLNQFNYINEQGELLSPKRWFSKCYTFYNGVAKVSFGGKYNFIKPNGQLLSPHVWFDTAGFFKNGYVSISIKGKHNFLTKEFDFLSPVWFDSVGDFNDGFAKVEIDGKGWNFLDRNGNLLSNDWFNSVGDFYGRFARVEIDGKGCNLLGKNGNLLSNDWFDSVGYFNGRFARVKIEGKGWNYINQKGNLLSPVWFEFVCDFEKGFAQVKNEGKYNLLGQNGELLSPVWFDYAGKFIDGFARVKIKGKGYNYIDRDGKLLSSVWFDSIMDFEGEFAEVYYKGKWNFLDRNGNLLSSVWFDETGYFNDDGYADVIYMGKRGRVDAKGNFYPL